MTGLLASSPTASSRFSVGSRRRTRSLTTSEHAGTNETRAPGPAALGRLLARAQHSPPHACHGRFAPAERPCRLERLIQLRRATQRVLLSTKFLSSRRATADADSTT